MSLPPLLRHVYNHGTEEVIRRGKKIFHTAGVQMLDVDHLLEQIRFRVRNDLYQNYYTVTVLKYLDPNNLSIRCQCPYNLGEICRHEVAALFQLNDILQSGFFENTDITYDQKHTIVRMRQVSIQMLRIFSAPEVLERAQDMARTKKAILVATVNDTIEAEVPDGDETYRVIIRQNDERYFDTSCGCKEDTHPLCTHKATVFLQVLNTYGQEYFQSLRNWDEQKNKLLRQYGYSLNDDLTDKFTFTYENGKPFLRVLDPTIKKVAVQPIVQRKEVVAQVVQQEVEEEVKPNEVRLGIVVDTHVSWYPFVNMLLVAGIPDDEEKKFVDGIEKLQLQQYVNPARYKEEERELIPIIRKFTPEELVKFLKKTLPFGDILDDYQQVLKETPGEEIKDQVWEYLLPKYKKLLERYSNYSLCFLHKPSPSLTSGSLEPIAFSDRRIHPQLNIGKRGADYVATISWIIDNINVQHEDVQMLNPALLLHDYQLYSVSNINEVYLIEQFLPDGEFVIPGAQWNDFLQKEIMQWSQVVHVNFDDELIENIDKVKPAFHLYLREREQMLLLQPAFSYHDVEIRWGFLEM